MSASTAIGMVGESLKTLLEEEMLVSTTVNVTLLAPDESGPSRRINLFLYKVEENIFLKNKDWEVSSSDPNQIKPPPLSLNLFYLMTAYAQNDTELGNVNAHEILGEAMRVMHENPFIPAEHLVDGLSDTREQVKVIQNNIDLDEMSKVWSTFSEPFRLSVPYEVSVIQLDHSGEEDMPTRVSTIGVPNVNAPFSVPVVTDISPVSGVAGSTVTFSGENLSGWKAYVKVSGQSVADGEDIEGDGFDITLPADLAAGFHQIKVDISKLHRSTFFFEVTAP